MSAADLTPGRTTGPATEVVGAAGPQVGHGADRATSSARLDPFPALRAAADLWTPP